MESLKSSYEGDPARPDRNILHMLADLQAYNGPVTRQARDTMLTHWEKLYAQNSIDKDANIRIQDKGTNQIAVKRTRKTGYAQYQEAKARVAHLKDPAKNAKFIKRMHELYTTYSHMDDVIAETVGLATATRHAGRPGSAPNN